MSAKCAQIYLSIPSLLCTLIRISKWNQLKPSKNLHISLTTGQNNYRWRALCDLAMQILLQFCALSLSAHIFHRNTLQRAISIFSFFLLLNTHIRITPCNLCWKPPPNSGLPLILFKAYLWIVLEIVEEDNNPAAWGCNQEPDQRIHPWIGQPNPKPKSGVQVSFWLNHRFNFWFDLFDFLFNLFWVQDRLLFGSRRRCRRETPYGTLGHTREKATRKHDAVFFFVKFFGWVSNTTQMLLSVKSCQ